MNTYTVDSISVVHSTNVDIYTNKISNPVHLVQYDDRLPILAVTIFNNGQEYTIPSTAEARLRVGKPDHTCVNVAALGMSSDKHTVYFEITKQMTMFEGTFHPTVELKIGDRVGHPSLLTFIVARNAIQDGYLESCVEYKEFFDYVNQVKAIAEEAKSIETRVKEADTHVAGVMEVIQNTETTARENAELSKSWAVGNTGVRPGENHNNSKYYADQAKSCEHEFSKLYKESSEVLNEIKSATDIVSFEVNDDGELIYDDGRGYDFTVDDDTGELIWTAVEETIQIEGTVHEDPIYTGGDE